MSITLKLSGKSSLLYANFFPPIKLEKESEIALMSLIFWYSLPNIDESNQNFYYSDGKTDHVIQIPVGSYEISDIENFLRYSLKKAHKPPALTDDQKFLLSGDYPLSLTGNTQTLKTELVCRYKVNFDYEKKPNNIGKLLGFKESTINPFEKAISENLVNIISVEVTNVECNLSGSSYYNGQAVHQVYEFFPNCPPGYRVVEIPRNLIYHRINTREISDIEIKLTDQTGKLLNLRGETIHCRLHIRPNA